MITETDPTTYQRPSVYQDGPLTVYRGSSLGNCLLSLVAARRGYVPMPQKAFLETVAAEGHLHEPDIVKKVEEIGDWMIRGIGENQLTLELEVGPNIVVRLHPDGIASRSGEERVFEAKSMSDAVFRKFHKGGFQSHPGYAWQFSGEMAATDLPGLFAYKNRNNGQLEILEVDYPPYSLADIKVRIARVEALANDEGIEVSEVACDIKGLGCLKYAYLHQAKSIDAPLPEHFDALKLDALAETYTRARDMKSLYEASMKEVRAEMMEMIPAESRMQSPRYKVIHSVQRRKDLDTKALFADHPEIDQSAYQVVREIPQIRVIEIGAVDGKASER